MKLSGMPGGDMTSCLFIRDEKEYAKVSLKDILYISGDAEYLSLFVDGRDKPYREKTSFEAIRRLLTEAFVQIHRSSLINMDHVSRVGRGYVIMDNGTRIRIADSRREHFDSMVHARTVGKNNLPS